MEHQTSAASHTRYNNGTCPIVERAASDYLPHGPTRQDHDVLFDNEEYERACHAISSVLALGAAVPYVHWSLRS